MNPEYLAGYGLCMLAAGAYLYHRFGTQASLKIGEIEFKARNAEQLAKVLASEVVKTVSKPITLVKKIL